ncbi:hypothetical protein [Sinorhizobium meliloti]|uniref:hypothetical protein n=1 Tax=Rhizobium meliloti TaxID=382 RepID=UPI000428CC27|nr:hypothetical protein [Sinorhizobium meliloti]MDE4619625.1 hypothetical protein [Sinorhizobium meliloti]
MKSQSYMTRAMSARDPRFATILGKLGYARGDMVAQKPKAAPATSSDDPLPDLRKRYQDIVGKRAFHGWDAETLQAKIAEAKAAK